MDRRRYLVVIVNDGGAQEQMVRGLDEAIHAYVTSPGHGLEAGDASVARTDIYRLPVGAVFHGAMGWVVRLQDVPRPHRSTSNRWSEIRLAARVVAFWERWRQRVEARLVALETRPAPLTHAAYIPGENRKGYTAPMSGKPGERCSFCGFTREG